MFHLAFQISARKLESLQIVNHKSLYHHQISHVCFKQITEERRPSYEERRPIILTYIHIHVRLDFDTVDLLDEVHRAF